MKAIVCHGFGPLDTLAYEEVAAPVPGAGEVLVRTEAAGVTAGQLGGAGRRAHRTHVVLQELDALGGEAVDGGGAYGGTVHAQVPPTEVVGQDEEDVRSVHDTTFAEAG